MIFSCSVTLDRKKSHHRKNQGHDTTENTGHLQLY